MWSSPGMPARPTSSGIVTYRSVSSALHPGGCAMTSTSGGTGFGYASMLSWLYECAPITMRPSARRIANAGVLRTKRTIFSIIGDPSQHRGDEDGAGGDDLVTLLEAVIDGQPFATLAFVDSDRGAL